MTTDGAFFEALASINADMESAAARLHEISGDNGTAPVINPEDSESIAVAVKMQDAQQRLSALMKTVNG